MFEQTEIDISIAASLIRDLAKHEKGIKVVHINAQSLMNFMNLGTCLFSLMFMIFVCLKHGSIACDDYVVYRADRFSQAGNVAIYVNTKLNSTVKCKHPLDNKIEYSLLKLSGKDLSSKALVGLLYA